MSSAGRGLAVSRAIEAVMQGDRGRLLAALIAQLRDFQLAEDALQEAALSALTDWGRAGLPASPQGWLLTVARRKALDRLRQSTRQGRHLAALGVLAAEEAEPDPDPIPDERLRLIFTCCHPALAPKSRVALTLRTVAGLSTAQIARAFLDTEVAMGQRLTRAKAKISAAGVPFAIPGPEEWADRLRPVLDVVYLVFNAGYSGPADLEEEALFLARLLVQLRPEEPEIEGLLALLLLVSGRRAARADAAGVLVPLERQNLALWDGNRLAQGEALLDAAMARRAPGPFQIKAAIQALHVAGRRQGAVDWAQIRLLYGALLRWEDTPVVRLNAAVALAETGALAPALAEVDRLAETLAEYQPLHAARADLLARLTRFQAARAAYDRAIALTDNPADLAFLVNRRASLPETAP